MGTDVTQTLVIIDTVLLVVILFLLIGPWRR